MFKQLKPKNAVAVIRVSSVKQGIQGDSPEAQKEQIRRFAASGNMRIKASFTFLESASKDLQPIQTAIDYCKDPKNNVQVMLVKAIDRFTRGGVGTYLQLKTQLELCGVELIDLHQIISVHKVNTLEHFGISYRWSVYSPTKNAEMLEAERASDEIRDISTRLIGSEIYYTREGYWMRRPPFGYLNEKLDTRNGRRSVLKADPQEARFIIRMFELRCRGIMDDNQIVDEINRLGFKTRINYIRSKDNRARIVGQSGGNALTLKSLWRYLHNPIYAGIICEKWTHNQPVRGKHIGLVSVDAFNRANRGKMTIAEEFGKITITKQARKPRPAIGRWPKTADYPYRRVVTCPICEFPLRGSASRGRNGKYYPAYHCTRGGYHFRIGKPAFEATLSAFMEKVCFTHDYATEIKQLVIGEFTHRRQSHQEDIRATKLKIAEMREEAKIVAGNLRYIRSATSLTYAEQELQDIDAQIKVLQDGLHEDDDLLLLTASELGLYVDYFGDRLGQLIFEQSDITARVAGFALLFKHAPAYTALEYLDARVLAEPFALSGKLPS